MNDNPAFGAKLQPFMGIPSYMRLPVTRDLTDVDVAILGVPYDSATSHRSGTRFGPRKIREMSLMIWGYNSTLHVYPTNELKVVDYGDVSITPTSILHTMNDITTMAYEIITKGVNLVTLGGDHSITLPLLRAHAKKYGALSVIHIDAHLDTCKSEFPEVPYSHGTPFRFALEERLIRKDSYIQIGIRGPVSGEKDYSDACELGARTITMHDVMEKGISEILDEIQSRVRGALYVSLDIDAADPAYAPGTGTPEVGGMTSYQLLSLVRGLQGLNIIGCDVVEVCPPFDHGDITCVLASNLVFEFLSLLALRKKFHQ